MSGLLRGAASHAPSSARPARAALEGYQQKPYCSSGRSTCVDAWRHAPGHYVGHDEPSVLFKSKIPGSGNNMTEFGHLLFTLFPNSNGKPFVATNNFNSGPMKNPCRA